ncbi:hypothetical protein ES703_91121 [subsurface metagenome]
MPDTEPVVLLREGEIDSELEPAGKGLIQVGPEIRRQDGHAIIGLHALQQIGDLDVGVAVMRVAHFGALAKKGIRLIEE